MIGCHWIFGVNQAFPTKAEPNESGLNRLLSGLNKYIQGFIPGFMVTELIHATDPRAGQEFF